MTRHSCSFAGSVFTAATVARRPLLPTEPVLNTVPYFSSRARFMSSLVATRGFSAGAGGSGAWWVLVGVVACGAGTGSDAGSGVEVSCFTLSRAVLTASAMSASTSTGLVVCGVGSGVVVSGVTVGVASSLVEASMLPRSSSPFWLLRVVVVWCARLVLVWRRRLIAERLYSLVVMGLVFFLGWFAGCFSCVVYSCFGAMFWVYLLFLF